VAGRSVGRGVRGRVRVVAGVVALGLWALTGQAVPAQAAPAGGPAARGRVTFLYVAERGAGAVGVYRSDSSGRARPVRVVRETAADGYPTDAWDVAVDSSGRLYVQNSLSESATRLYAAGADGAATPQRVFRGYTRDSPALAVGPDGTTYVARLQSPEVDVFAPTASGQTQPAVLTLDGIPRSLTVDPAGELVVAVEAVGSAGSNALEVFRPGATGSAAPTRRITGPATGLGATHGPFGDGEHVVVTSSAFTHRLYAAVTGAPADPANTISGLPTHISVFSETAAGDVTPLRTISGPATAMTGTVLTGIADNPASGNIWVMATRGGLGEPTSTGRVLDFPRLGAGNIAPVRSFTDATTGFADVQGIAFSTR